MTTSDQFVHLTNKKLLGVSSFSTYLFNYLRNGIRDFTAAIYNRDGTFGSAPLDITESDDLISIADGEGTDGLGNLFEIGETEQDVPWERTSGVEYGVAIHYTERPVGIQINPRTGAPEYQNWQEVIGSRGEPDDVSVVSGHLEIVIDSLGDSGHSLAGRRCLVWLTTPAAGALTEAIAIEECEVQFESSSNFIETTGLLGSSLGETNPAMYQVLLLGPTISSEEDLESAEGYWFLGYILNDGGSFEYDPDDQWLIRKSLADLLEYLVYSNIVNSFTRGQIIAGAADETGLDVTAGSGSNVYGIISRGAGTGPGIYVEGGTSGGAGIVARGGYGIGAGPAGKFDSMAGNERAIEAAGRGSGAGVWSYGGGSGGIGVEGHGGISSGSGAGLKGTGGAPDGDGVQGNGDGDGVGGRFIGGHGGTTFGLYGAYGVYGKGGTGTVFGGVGGYFTGGDGTIPGIGLLVEGGAGMGGASISSGASSNAAALTCTSNSNGVAIEAHADDTGSAVYAHSDGGAGVVASGGDAADTYMGFPAVIGNAGNHGASGVLGRAHAYVSGVPKTGTHSFGVEGKGPGATEEGNETYALGGGLFRSGEHAGSEAIRALATATGATGIYVNADDGTGIECKGGDDSYGAMFEGGSNDGDGIYCEAGGANAVGGFFVGGSEGAAIRLWPRSDEPDTLDNGCIWVTGSEICVRIGGTSYKLDKTAL